MRRVAGPRRPRRDSRGRTRPRHFLLYQPPHRQARPVPVRYRRRRWRHRLSRVHARPLQPAPLRRARPLDPRRAASRLMGEAWSDWYALRLPRRRRASSATPRPTARSSSATTSSAGRPDQQPAVGLPGGSTVPSCPCRPWPGPAATPPATSARSSPATRGPCRRRDLVRRRCGICATQLGVQLTRVAGHARDGTLPANPSMIAHPHHLLSSGEPASAGRRETPTLTATLPGVGRWTAGRPTAQHCNCPGRYGCSTWAPRAWSLSSKSS